MRAVPVALTLPLLAMLAACSGGSAPDLSAIDDPQSGGAFILATAEIADFNCETKSLEIGRKQEDGTYRKATSVAIGTPWAPATGVQTSLAPGEYHVVGMICMTKGNAMTIIPGRREASAVPFNPIYEDSIAQFTVAAREVVSLGAFRFVLGENGPVGIAHAPLAADIRTAAKNALPKIGDRLTDRRPTVVAQSVGGRCFAGGAKMDCAEIGKIRTLCKSDSPAAGDVATLALRARLKGILCG